jgi:hypothetical protein
MKYTGQNTRRITAYAAAFLFVIGFSYLACGQVKDLPGWQNTRWGMEQKDSQMVQGLTLKKLTERNHFLNNGVP